MKIEDNNVLNKSYVQIKGDIFRREFVHRIQSTLIDVVHTTGPTIFDALYDEFAPIFECAIFRAILQTILDSKAYTLSAVSQVYAISVKDGQIDYFTAKPTSYIFDEIDLIYSPTDGSKFYDFLSANMADTKWPMDSKNARYCYYVYVQSARYTFAEPCSFTLINLQFGTYTIKQYTQYHYKMEHFIGFRLYQMWTEELQKQIKSD